MSDYDRDARLRSWSRSASDRPAPPELRHRILDIPTTEPTMKRRRWLWFLPDPKPTAGAQDERGTTRRPANPISRPRGLVLAPTGGMTRMLSATKVIGLTAVAAVVGALLLAVPGRVEQEALQIGAPVDASAYLTPVSGTVTVKRQNFVGTTEFGPIDGNGIGYVDQLWTMRYDIDDQRLDGMSRVRSNHFTLGGGDLRHSTYYLVNDGGTWTGTGFEYQDPLTSGIHNRQVLDGHGGYEGLHAVLDWDQPAYAADFDVTGVIIAGDLPPLPEPAPETFD